MGSRMEVRMEPPLRRRGTRAAKGREEVLVVTIPWLRLLEVVDMTGLSMTGRGGAMSMRSTDNEWMDDMRVVRRVGCV